MKELIHDVTDEDLEEQRKIREQIRERWDKLGFTEGVKKNIEFENLMELYESLARVLDKDFWKDIGYILRDCSLSKEWVNDEEYDLHINVDVQKITPIDKIVFDLIIR